MVMHCDRLEYHVTRSDCYLQGQGLIEGPTPPKQFISCGVCYQTFCNQTLSESGITCEQLRLLCSLCKELP